jgi:hypothetical protein
MPKPLFSKDSSQTVSTGYLSSKSLYNQSPLVPQKRRIAGSRNDPVLQSVENRFPYGARDGSLTPMNARPQAASNPLLRNADNDGLNQQQNLTPIHRHSTIRSRNPLEVLQQRSLSGRPLAAITIQTVYATLSRYTTYIQNFRRDPLALARRVIANAWRSNWAMFGKLSWWVLGLFLGHRQPVSDHPAWDWDRYDGESIASKHCAPGEQDTERVETLPAEREDHDRQHIETESKRALDHKRRSVKKRKQRMKEAKSTWGQSLFLWGKFSVAIMLAVGGAIVKGPAEMLRETEERRRSRSNSLENSPRYSATAPWSHSGGIPYDGYQVQNPLRLPPEPLHHAHPTKNRMTRSFSSPLLSPRYDDSNMMTGAFLAKAVQGGRLESHKSCHDDDGRSDSNSVNNITLRPTRSPERRRLDSVFRPPGTDNGDASDHG